MPRLTPDQLADVRNAWGFGVPLETLAPQVGLSVDELRIELGQPAWRPVQRDLFEDQPQAK